MCISGPSPWHTPENVGQKRQGHLSHSAAFGPRSPLQAGVCGKGVAANAALVCGLFNRLEFLYYKGRALKEQMAKIGTRRQALAEVNPTTKE